MAQLDNSHNENEELELLKQLCAGPKIAINQDDYTTVYALVLEGMGENQSWNTVVQSAAESYMDECGQLDESVVTHILTVKSRIGNGGFGVVYRAELSSVKGNVADPRLCLKMGFHKSSYPSEEARLQAQRKINASIFREAQNFKILSSFPAHETIIDFRFCCESDMNEYIIGLEYFEGKNLSEVLREMNPLPSKYLHDIMRQCAAAVKHLWGLNIVHCDIKPRNVLYNCNTKKLKFIDFGSAVLLEKVHQYQDNQDENCGAAGTPEYMAFELLHDGLFGVQEKSDIYSLGMLYYRLVTHQIPWHFIEEIEAARHDHNNVSIKQQILKACKLCVGPSPIQDRIVSKDESFYRENSNECEIIRNMLNLNPSDRPSCEELVLRLHELDRVQRQSSQISFSDSASDLPTVLSSFDSTNTAESTIPNEVRRSHAALLEGNEVTFDVGVECPEGEYVGEEERLFTEDQ